MKTKSSILWNSTGMDIKNYPSIKKAMQEYAEEYHKNKLRELKKKENPELFEIIARSVWDDLVLNDIESRCAIRDNFFYITLSKDGKEINEMVEKDITKRIISASEIVEGMMIELLKQLKQTIHTL